MTGFLSDRDYAFVYSRVPRICVSVVLTSGQGVALVKRVQPPAQGLWHLPGGRIFKGETVEQAAIRVLKRELGILPAYFILADVSYIENLSESYAPGLDIHNIDIVLRAESSSEVFAPEKGEGEPRWFKDLPPRDEWSVKHIEFLRVRGFL